MKSNLKLIVALLVFFLSSTVFATTEEEYARLFGQWVQEHHKVYNEDEVLYRFRVFKQNFDFVENFKSEEHTFTVELNKFADLTSSEFLEKYTGLHRPLIAVPDPEHISQEGTLAPLAKAVDWRKKGVVTPVKDQGQCGSCWSFSTTGAVEGVWAQNNSLVSLSEQNLMDCSRAYGNYGCNGGYMDSAFKYIINNRGIDTEDSYPYLGYTYYQCKYNTSNKGAAISSYKDVTSGSETELQTAVTKRPVSVAIDASQTSFQFYSGGYYYEPKCSSTNLDHGVLCVGFGSGTDGDYWIVKNSWGTKWGDKGYIYMARNKSNNCGIATMASYPIL